MNKNQKTTTKQKFTVSQTFESLGDPCPEVFTNIEEAEEAAEVFRKEIASMVSGWEVPRVRYHSDTGGCSNEIAAWEKAQDIANVEYEDGELTDEGPTEWGDEVGAYIANLAVTIETEDI